MMSFFILENKIREINKERIVFKTSVDPYTQLFVFEKIPDDEICSKLFDYIKENFKWVESAIICIKEQNYTKNTAIYFTESKYHILPVRKKDIDSWIKSGDTVRLMGKPRIRL
jgi:hypothetical protein